MAVDTRNRRSAAVGVGQAWLGRLPLADGSIGANDRRHLTYAYGGLADALDTPISSGTIDWTIPACRLEYTIPTARLDYTAPEV